MNMNSRTPRILLALLFLTVVLLPLSQVAAAGGSSTEQSVRATLDQGLAAFDREDLDGTLKALHPESPNYEVSKDRISRVFDNHDIKFELVDFDFLGESPPYAFARVKEKSTKISDTDFRNNTTDSIYIFRKYRGQWKLWGEYELETVFAD